MLEVEEAISLILYAALRADVDVSVTDGSTWWTAELHKQQRQREAEVGAHGFVRLQQTSWVKNTTRKHVKNNI